MALERSTGPTPEECYKLRKSGQQSPRPAAPSARLKLPPPLEKNAQANTDNRAHTLSMACKNRKWRYDDGLKITEKPEGFVIAIENVSAGPSHFGNSPSGTGRRDF